MYGNSMIISYVMNLADGLEKSYRYSYICKWAKSLSHTFKNRWRDSGFGQIIDNIFNIETHRSSMSYKFATKPFLALMNFINDMLNLEQGIADSKYIKLVKKSGLLSRKPEIKENIAKATFRNSIFVRCIYEFWEGMD